MISCLTNVVFIVCFFVCVSFAQNSKLCDPDTLSSDDLESIFESCVKYYIRKVQCFDDKPMSLSDNLQIEYIARNLKIRFENQYPASGNYVLKDVLFEFLAKLASSDSNQVPQGNNKANMGISG